MMRTPNNEMNTGLKKGAWSPEEDEKLISYINRYGIWNWSQMPRFAGLSRSGKSCRLRWMNYLKPNVKRGNFTKEEEEIVLQCHLLLGNKWSAIASRLPGRTDNEVKNYWHTHLKKRTTEQTMLCEKTDQHDMNTSSNFEADNAEKTQEPDIQVNDTFKFHSTSEDHDRSSLRSSTATSKDQEVDFRADHYYDIGSPGMVDDFQCFWNQLSPFKNLELGNNLPDMFSDPVFQDSYNGTGNTRPDMFSDLVFQDSYNDAGNNRLDMFSDPVFQDSYNDAGNNRPPMFSDPLFQDSYNDAISSYSFYNNYFDTLKPTGLNGIEPDL